MAVYCFINVSVPVEARGSIATLYEWSSHNGLSGLAEPPNSAVSLKLAGVWGWWDRTRFFGDPYGDQREVVLDLTRCEFDEQLVSKKWMSRQNSSLFDQGPFTVAT